MSGVDGYGRRPDDIQGDTLSPPGVIIQGGQVIRFRTRVWFPGAPFKQAPIGVAGSQVLIVGPGEPPIGADRAEIRITVPISGVYEWQSENLLFPQPGTPAGGAVDLNHTCTPPDVAGRQNQNPAIYSVPVAPAGQYASIAGSSFWDLEAGTLYVLQALLTARAGNNWDYYVDPLFARAMFRLSDVVTG